MISENAVVGRRRPRGEEEVVMEFERKKKQRMMNKNQTSMLGGVEFSVDSKYAPLEVLGSGAYGVVCSCVNRETKEEVAIKKITDAFENETTALRALREIQILRRIGRHDNIISLKDVMLSSSLKSSCRHVYLVQESMDFDLSRVIGFLSVDHIRYIMFQILSGLKFLHSANVIHRDLKPQNILLNSNSDLKICDFGLARTKRLDPQKMTEYMVTRWYRAPELLTGSVWYGPGIDVWSAGCVLAEMLLHGDPIFPGKNSLDQVNIVFDVLGTPSDISFIQSFRFRQYIAGLPRSSGDKFEKMFQDSAEPLVLDLLKKMLALNPWDRISASKALEHPYFSGLYDPDCDDSTPAATINLEVDENPGVVDMKTIRDLMWEEMLFYRPQERTQEIARKVKQEEKQFNAKLEATRNDLNLPPKKRNRLNQDYYQNTMQDREEEDDFPIELNKPYYESGELSHYYEKEEEEIKEKKEEETSKDNHQEKGGNNKDKSRNSFDLNIAYEAAEELVVEPTYQEEDAIQRV